MRSIMTGEGMRLVRDARTVLAEVDAALAARIGPEAAAQLRAALEAEWGESPGDGASAEPARP